MKKGLLLAGAGAIVAAAFFRKPKKKRKTKTPPNTVVATGTGYSEVLGINVRWTVSRVSGVYTWEWRAVNPTAAAEKGVPSEDSSGPYESEGEATDVLHEALGLQPLPKPEGPLGEGEPEIPGPPKPPTPPLPTPPAPPNPVGPVPGMGLGNPKPPGPVAEPPGQLFPLELYPADGDASKLPQLTDAAGMVISEDCTVAGVGPMFWDGVGDRFETLSGDDVDDHDTIMEILAEDLFPMKEIHLCPAALLIYNEISGRVRENLEG